MLQTASDARERKKKFSGSVEVLRFERTLELTKQRLRKTDNIARNDARLQSTMMLMFQDAKTGLRSVQNGDVTLADHGVPSESRGCLPQTSISHIPQQLVEKCVTEDLRNSACVLSSVVMTTASVANLTSVGVPSSVVMTSVAKVTASVTKMTSSMTTAVSKTTAPFTVMSMASMATSSGVRETAATTCVSLPLNDNLAAVSVANMSKTNVASSGHVTITSDKSGSSVARGADDVSVKSNDYVTEQLADSTDVISVIAGKSVDSVVTLADAVTVKSVDLVAATSTESTEAVTVTAGKSVDAVVKSADEVTMPPVAVMSASFKELPISSPVPLSNIKNLSTPQSPSPSPKGHVTFSDHVTEIQPSVGSDGDVNGKPRRIPPPPPPRKAIKNVTLNACPTSLQSKPRDRPISAVEPLGTSVDGRSGYPAVNGVGRTRPVSMAPLATVDSDSDSSVGIESQTGTIKRNTAQSADKRNPGGELRFGARGRTPPPVPTRKTSSLTLSSASAVKIADGILTQDVQYSNLDDVRQECARLELASSRPDGRANGTKIDGMAKCEETEIY